MLNELETLSRNIGRLVALNQRHHAETLKLEEQLAQQGTETEALRAEVAQLRAERDALASERDVLSAKIDDAQVKLNAILEKLPHTKGGSDADAQLDLLEEPSEQGEPSQGEHA